MPWASRPSSPTGRPSTCLGSCFESEGVGARNARPSPVKGGINRDDQDPKQVLGITTIISYGTTQYLFGVLVVPVDATFHWGRASISGAYTLGLIIAGLLGVPIGHLVDRWGARLL